MNKYIYKVRFVTLYNKNSMHKHELFLQTTTVSTNEKLIANKSLGSMNASYLFSKKFHF